MFNEDMTAKQMFSELKGRLAADGKTYLFLDKIQQITAVKCSPEKSDGHFLQKGLTPMKKKIRIPLAAPEMKAFIH